MYFEEDYDWTEAFQQSVSLICMQEIRINQDWESLMVTALGSTDDDLNLRNFCEKWWDMKIILHKNDEEDFVLIENLEDEW